MFAILHGPLYTAFSNGFDSPVAEMRLRVSDPIFAVFTIFVATRANDGEYLGVDYFFTFLVG